MGGICEPDMIQYSITSRKPIFIKKFAGASKNQPDLEGTQKVSDADLRLTTWYKFHKSTEKVKIILLPFKWPNKARSFASILNVQ